MATKNKPGRFDCYTNADPDEPMFVLLGRDPMAGALVRLWALQRRHKGENPEKVAEAQTCADAMDAWAKSLGKTPTEADLDLYDLEAVHAACSTLTAFAYRRNLPEMLERAAKAYNDRADSEDVLKVATLRRFAEMFLTKESP